MNHARAAVAKGWALSGGRSRSRRRALLLFAALAVLLHAMLLGGSDWSALGPPHEAGTGMPMTVRNIETPSAETPVATLTAAEPAALPPPKPRRRRIAAAPTIDAVAPAAAASAPTVEPPDPPASEPRLAQAAASSEPEAGVAALPLDAAPAAASDAAAASGPVVAASPPASAAVISGSFLAAGELPPPTYKTKLPPSMTLSYEVRRGFLRGTGEIRWQHVGDDYGLRLEARIAGLTLLAQTSQGVVDAAGLAPVRFLDQRARRAAQAANFRRDADIISFSGPSVVWPLLPGSQDQLSWMIQLAAIVAAEPERASEGGRISMVIVGARGDASVRTLRFAGREAASTASGTVPALKFIVDARSTYDSSYEIWLDPALDYLPAHATRRNSAGDAEFDLLLERAEPIP